MRKDILNAIILHAQELNKNLKNSVFALCAMLHVIVVQRVKLETGRGTNPFAPSFLSLF